MAASSGLDLQTPPTTPPRRIAPLWHTIVLIVVLGAFSYLGAKSGHPVAQAGLVPQYVSMMIVEWLAFGYVLWGLHKGGALTMRQVIGGRWNKVEDFLLEIAIAAGFWIVSLLVLGAVTVACAFLKLEVVIAATMTTRILVQFVAQIFALPLLRRRLSKRERPYRMWLYPVPAVIALVGWLYVFVTSGAKPIEVGLVMLVMGVAVYFCTARSRRQSQAAARAVAVQ